METQIEERRFECLLMSYGKIQKLMRKARDRGRNAEIYLIHISPATEQPAGFHTREELTAKQRENFRSLLFDDFHELM
jgi:hypothetical protein